MQKRQLSSTDIYTSLLGLGTVKFGRNKNVKYPKSFALPTDQDIVKLLNLAHDQGINLLDTAPAYGESETRLGKLLKGARGEWIISSKAGEAFNDGLSTYDYSKQALTESVHNSLRALNTDYIDILLIHSNGDDETIIERHDVFRTLAEFKTAGKIRSYGMSTKTVEGGLRTIQHADVAMVTVRPDYRDELAVVEKAAQLKKGILIKKALGSGHAAQNIEETFQFLHRYPAVASIIVGTINPQHLKDNITAMNAVSL